MLSQSNQNSASLDINKCSHALPLIQDVIGTRKRKVMSGPGSVEGRGRKFVEAKT